MKKHRGIDKRQKVLFPKTLAETGPGVITTTTATFSMHEQFACAYCLHIDKLQKFLISTKKGFHQGLAQCPECKNKMRFTSLTAEWTPEQYAKFVFEAMLSGFFQKIPFHTWSDRLHKMGWSYRFWREYKKLKGGEGEESYADRMDRLAQEYVDEHEEEPL